MNLVDLIVLAIIAISALLGLSRGFAREMLGLASWLIAAGDIGFSDMAPDAVDFSHRCKR